MAHHDFFFCCSKSVFILYYPSLCLWNLLITQTFFGYSSLFHVFVKFTKLSFFVICHWNFLANGSSFFSCPISLFNIHFCCFPALSFISNEIAWHSPPYCTLDIIQHKIIFFVFNGILNTLFCFWTILLAIFYDFYFVLSFVCYYCVMYIVKVTSADNMPW